MWPLLKAEWDDNKYLLLVIFIFMELNFLTMAYLDRSQAPLVSSLPHLLTVVALIFFFNRRFTEKRVRLQQLLPLSLKDLSVGRIFFQLWFWAGALLLCGLSHLFYGSDSARHYLVWRLLALNSLLISTNAVYLISYDLWTDVSEKSNSTRVAIIILLWIYIFLSGHFYIEPESWPLATADSIPAVNRIFYFTPWGVLLLHLISFGLCFGSVKVYQRRRTYFT